MLTHRSAPAQDNILLIRMTWKGWTRTRKWKESLPEVLVTYLESIGQWRRTIGMNGKTHLLAQIRAASSASELNCSYSSETRWQQKGNSSTEARLRPRSKMRICVALMHDLVQESEYNTPSGPGHHGCTYSSGRACSCSNGSSERDGDPSCPIFVIRSDKCAERDQAQAGG